MRCYVVIGGKNRSGIFQDRTEAYNQVYKQKGSRIRKFSDQQAAEAFWETIKDSATTKIPCYVVLGGKNRSGVFKDKKEAYDQAYKQKGSSIRKFATMQSAEEFWLTVKDEFDKETQSVCCIATVDGSFSKERNTMSYGVVVNLGNHEQHLSGKIQRRQNMVLSNTTAELYSAIKAVEYCLTLQAVNQLKIVYDAKVVDPEVAFNLKSKYSALSNRYKKALNQAKQKGIVISFQHTKAHASDFNNNLADALARRANNMSAQLKYQTHIQEVDVINAIVSLKKCSFEKAKKCLEAI